MVETFELVGTRGRSGLQKFALLIGGALVGALIAVLILLAVNHGRANRIATNTTTGPGAAHHNRIVGPTLHTQDFLQGRYYPNRNNGTWISAHELLYRDDLGNIRTYNAQTRTTSMLLDGDVGDVLQATEIHLSADRKYLLIAKNVQRIFRHSSFAYYDAIELATKKSFPIAQNETADFLQLVEWSSVGNALVFVQSNNIFYKPAVEARAVQITDDGSRSVGYGTCDWVYEEEIFASKTALWFSPDGKRLAFVRFDDTNVPVMNIPVYGEPGRPESQYAQLVGLHYPKVGAPNPIVTLYAVDLSASTRPGQTILRHDQTVPAALRTEEHIISAVGWQSNETFVASWMNRVQNRAYLQACRDSTCTVFKTLNSTTGWVDLYKPLKFSEDGLQLVLISAHEQNNGNRSLGGYRHVTLVSTIDGSESALTSGAFEVTKILHWDAATKRIFYEANEEGRPEVQHVWWVRAEVGGARSDCLTCALVVDGANQTYFSAEFSPGRYAVVSSEGPGIPSVGVYEWTVDSGAQLKQIEVLDANNDLREIIRGVPLPVISYMDVPLHNDNFTARVRVIEHANIDRSGKTKYAMLVNVYGGPDSFNGYDKFDLGWANVLVSTRAIVHVQINGRGSGLRGDRLRHAIYRRFGQVEVDDQIEVTRKLVKMLPYVDGERVAIWGWSYGGFASALALAKDREHVFRCAASVAPVTDFRLYDSIYTERFMGLPSAQDNAAGYEATAIYMMPEQFRNRTFFLVHGTFDDNVHYQQSMALSRSLELHDVLFRQMSYPDEGHSLGSVQTHLYHTLGHYFDECFGA